MKLPIDPEIAPSDLGPLTVAKQQTVLVQLQERLKVLYAHATLKQQQSDLVNDTQFNPNSEVQFADGEMVRVFVKERVPLLPDGTGHMKSKQSVTSAWP